MKHSIKNIFALALALAMALSLTACSGSGGGGAGDGDSDRVTPIVKSPEADPAGYLAMALENTANELKDRYAGSPLAAIAGALDTAGTLAVSGELETYDGYVSIDDLSLAYDLEEKSFLLNMDAAAYGMEINAGACLTPDFVGISFPLLTGHDDYYGVKPRDIGSQLKSSFLWEYVRDEMNTSDLDQIDEMLDLLWDAELVDVDTLIKDSQSLGMDFIKGLDVDYEEDTVELDGKDVDGYVFTTTVDSDDLAALVEKVYDMVLDMPMWDTVEEFGKIAGGDFDMDELMAFLDDAMDETLDGIRSEDLRIKLTCNVADQKVVSMTAYEREYGVDVTVNFYDGGDITGSVEADSTELEFSSHVSTRKGYTHELTLTAEGETATIYAEWDGDELSLDVDIPYETPTTLTCGLSATRNGFEISDITYENEYMSRPETLPLTLEYTAGGSVSTPRNTNNLLTLNEEELRDLITGIGDLVDGMMDSAW